ncbi:MAG: cytochrome C [Caldilineaceae bacterium]|nr:cytochrome C [Caldilineaceae bacterium]MBP8109416.1 cytochrome C [Caldilineaceae bacterium]MBP8124001.1 cytochrome C [Caldilineaceae bacterium]MBP9074060.1 cytochrome C [Caldilineaceae bacterium]
MTDPTGSTPASAPAGVSESGEKLSAIARLSRQPTFRISTMFFVAAAILLALSTFFPYWRMRLNAPQYPKGLYVTVYVNHMTGDVAEIDGLNHYIGMAPLNKAAKIERAIAPIAMVVIALLILGVALIHSKWFAIFAIPAMTFPLIFLADLWLWLRFYGNNLDPTAPLSSAIKPFTPAVLFTGHVGQFSTTAWVLPGWYLALLAAILTGVGLHFRRQARLAAEKDG